jgi:hypothetical protein
MTVRELIEISGSDLANVSCKIIVTVQPSGELRKYSRGCSLLGTVIERNRQCLLQKDAVDLPSLRGSQTGMREISFVGGDPI